ncbi:helix-turn-helix protein [Cohnella sp. SGD-V74]|uniref:helix-turn-helix domain-containing protein n=1 Tax=unclassified Cohnella TaxID=2636738 RepID=UPI000D4526CD|nr:MULTISPECIES: helix-turn-helix transcriptional regulator [unclassified Cohnella]PRX71842.1 helix-turn-helix protein [Cohnella sp. SGD-V74]
MERNEIIAERLKTCREKRKLKKTDVVELINVPYSTYANWESGAREPSSKDLVRLADFYRVSLDYLFGLTDVPTVPIQQDVKEGGKSLDALRGIVGDFKSLWNERDRNIKIRKSLYNQLFEDADMREDRVHFIVNRIISSYYIGIETERRKEEEEIQKEAELTDYYIYLDRYLHASIGHNVEIGITNERVGKEGTQDNYILMDYKLSQPYHYLKLHLERNNEKWPISFHEIQDIKFLKCGDDRLKVWIYMPKQTWRFYLNYDPRSVMSSEISDKLELT